MAKGITGVPKQLAGAPGFALALRMRCVPRILIKILNLPNLSACQIPASVSWMFILKRKPLKPECYILRTLMTLFRR